MKFSEIQNRKDRTSERFTAGDVILLAALIVISVFGFISVKELFPEGTDVIIEVEGRTVYRLSLNEDAAVSVKGIIGHTMVEIKDGKVHVKDSPCQNKLCVEHGWITRGSIICLPNRVVVSIKTSGKEKTRHKDIDAITG